MASVVDICNSALNLLGASTISSLTEDSKNARLCNQRYEPIRNRTFRSHAWNFATKRVQLAKGVSSSSWICKSIYFTKWLFKSFKSANCTTDSIKDDLPYVVEGRKIKTDEGTIFLVYIALITDPNLYDSYFNEALSAALAADIAYAITNNATLSNNYQSIADERLREARFIDATENSLGTVESNEFTDARL